MPRSRDVLFYKEFEFEDGGKSDKLFIVLCSHSYCLVLKTTSNSKFYKGVKEGCNPQQRVFFIPLRKKEFFQLDTYVQLPQLYEISIPELIKGGLSKKIIIHESVLSSECLELIRNCLKHFKDDITPEHWEQLFSGAPDSPSNESLQKLASKYRNKK
jgi:hypothetical protein